MLVIRTIDELSGHRLRRRRLYEDNIKINCNEMVWTGVLCTVTNTVTNLWVPYIVEYQLRIESIHVVSCLFVSDNFCSVLSHLINIRTLNYRRSFMAVLCCN